MLNIKLKINGTKIGNFVFLMMKYSVNENFSKLLPQFEKTIKELYIQVLPSKLLKFQFWP